MTMSQQDQPPIHHPGPKINNNPTTLSIYSPTQLTSSPFLPSLLKTINSAFRTSYLKNPELGLHTDGDRLSTSADFLSAFSSDPESFTLIIHQPDSSYVLATASARRFHGPPDPAGPVTKDTPWQRKLDVVEGCEEWELRFMVTAEEAQGQGVAGFMMGAVEGEVRRRYVEKVESGRAEEGKRLRIVLCTPRELTGEFYLRRGFVRDYETWRGEGYQFHIVHLSKDVGMAKERESAESRGGDMRESC